MVASACIAITTTRPMVAVGVALHLCACSLADLATFGAITWRASRCHDRQMRRAVAAFFSADAEALLLASVGGVQVLRVLSFRSHDGAARHRSRRRCSERHRQ